jgi:hypothetical protein
MAVSKTVFPQRLQPVAERFGSFSKQAVGDTGRALRQIESALAARRRQA